MAGRMKTPHGVEVDVGPGHTVLNRELPPGDRRTAARPVFGTSYCGYGCPSHLLLSSCANGRPKTVRYMLSDSCPVLCVTLVYCGQTVWWIKMKLGMQVGLGTGHIVSDMDPARPCPHCVRCSPSSPCLKGAQSLNFLTMSVMGKRLDRSRWQLVEK